VVWCLWGGGNKVDKTYFYFPISIENPRNLKASQMQLKRGNHDVLKKKKGAIRRAAGLIKEGGEGGVQD